MDQFEEKPKNKEKKVIILTYLNSLDKIKPSENYFDYYDRINLNCDSLHIEFHLNDSCFKVEYFYLAYKKLVNHDCVIHLGSEIGRITRIQPSFTFGHGGIYYTSDSTLKNDIRKWKEKLSCP